jgi:hypothetical protein
MSFLVISAETCKDIFGVLDGSAFTRILWRQIKPIILGVIPYAPDTPAVRKIIKEVRQKSTHTDPNRS